MNSFLYQLLVGQPPYDLGQNASQSYDAEVAARRASELAAIPIEYRVAQLEFACAGLWKLLKEKLGCTDDELLSAMRGAPNAGGVRADEDVCLSCGKKLLTLLSPRCSWCGANLNQSPFAGN